MKTLKAISTITKKAVDVFIEGAPTIAFIWIILGFFWWVLPMTLAGFALAILWLVSDEYYVHGDWARTLVATWQGIATLTVTILVLSFVAWDQIQYQMRVLLSLLGLITLI